MNPRVSSWICLAFCAVLCGCAGLASSPNSSSTGSGSSQAASLTVNITGDGSVQSTPSGVACSGSVCSGSFAEGTAVSLTPVPAAGETFTGWGGACSGTGACTVTISSAQTVTATFAASAMTAQLQVQLAGGGAGTVSSTPAGISCGTTCSAAFPTGTQVTLAETPAAGSTFTGWGGACSGTAACTVTLSAAQTVTATFVQTTPLQVQLAGGGAGTVSSTPAGISCGTTCSAGFATGSQVTLTETPAAGSTFTSWGGACSGTAACTVTMSAAQTVTATFDSSAAPVSLQVQLAGTGAGSVVSTPVGINCGPTCTASFPTGTQVTLTTTANTGSTFAEWSGACTGSGSCTVTMSAAESVTATFTGTSTAGLTAINHIIFMLQENRGFDHYFGHLNDYRASLGLPQEVDDEVMYQQMHGGPPSNPCRDGASCGFSGGTSISAYHLNTMCVENPSPSWNESHVDWNKGSPTSQTPKLDGFVTTAAGDAIADGFHDTLGRRTIGYYTSDDLPYYYFMATQFATSDRWFSPVISRTHPNRMYSMAATSEGHAYPIPSGGKQLDAKTIFNLLDAAGITWKVYAGGKSSYFDMFTYANSHAANIVPLTDYMMDVQNGTLPQVAYLEPSESTDEHPGIDPNEPGPDIQIDSKYTSTLINALMTSSSWKDSVFILSFDEGGGFFDHVPPMAEVNPDGIKPQDLRPNDVCTKGEADPSNCDFNRSGYRLPLIVISPFTKANYVSHTPMDYTAVLKLIETRFGLPSLTLRDAAQPDMTEFFDFQNVPWATPPTPPVQPVKGGVCYNDKLP